MHIAVIEEERPIQDIVRYALELGGHQVEAYYTAPENWCSYDLVIIEPGEDGQGFLTIHQLLKLYHLPVLVLTFYEQNIDFAQQQQLPILRKMPFRLTALLEMVDKTHTRPILHYVETTTRPY